MQSSRAGKLLRPSNSATCKRDCSRSAHVFALRHPRERIPMSYGVERASEAVTSRYRRWTVADEKLTVLEAYLQEKVLNVDKRVQGGGS